MKPQGTKGVVIALSILFAWTASTALLLFSSLAWYNPFNWLAVLWQTHLFTGLFITAHDAMHHTVSANRRLNHFIGKVCALLFMFNRYNHLYKKHHEHHRFVASEHDPDYHHSGHFLRWYLSFIKQYVSVWQIVWVAVLFNLLLLFFPEPNLVLFWVLPSFLSTLQLFYFGTYLPHKHEHNSTDAYKAKSQKRNHFWAFLSCYFFGYHYEHHRFPGTPWWQLYKRKEEVDLQH